MNSERWSGPLTAAALTLAVFAPWALRCGLYLDDFTFFLSLPAASWSEVRRIAAEYVPGRNLFIPLMAGLLKLSRSSPLLLHGFCLAVAALNAGLAHLLYRRIGAPASAALPASAFFAVMGNHGETHFTITQGVQCLIPTGIVIAAFLAALHRNWRPERRLMITAALYLPAFFIYDQVFFLGPLLLACVWWTTEPERRRSLVFPFAAAAGAALAVFYVLLRHFSIHEGGGRPVIRLSAIPLRAAQSVYETLKGTPSWPDFNARAVAGTALGLLMGWLLLRLQQRWSRGEATANWTSTAPLRWIAFGSAWWLLAYLPIYFWYLSPRHNYLPSLGWSLAAVAAANRLCALRPAAARWMTPAGVLIFALSVGANFSEGGQWVEAAALRRSYLAEAARFSDTDNVFLIGAPIRIGHAPAFQLYHDHALSAALQAGRRIMTGDNQLTPTRRGAFYFNELRIWGTSALRWQAYESLNAVSYTPQSGFVCLGSLDVRSPTGETLRRALRPTTGCDARLGVVMDAGLVSTQEVPASTGGLPAAGFPGLRLTRHALIQRPGTLDLTLEWTVDAPLPDALAVAPQIYSPSGALLFEPVYRSATRRGAAMFVPLLNDERPADSWKPGRSVRETYRLRLDRPLPEGPCRLDLRLFLLARSGSVKENSLLSLRTELGPAL